MTRKFAHIIFTLAFFTAGSAMAQLKVIPIKNDNANAGDRPFANVRTTANEPLNLPFWDDFSFTGHQPADTLWQNSANIYVNNGLASNPPSIGVASFDGLDALGNPMAIEDTESGKTDSLTSMPVDLSGLSPESNVYISFFYQYAGTGEGPDTGDSLRLEVKNSSGEWISIWPGNAELNRTGAFTQVIEKIDDPSFFHDHFQFKFQSFGLRSGPYDIWNVDYVYVNKNRSETDTSFPDRTINKPLTSFLKNYTAIPYSHFHINDTIHPTFGIANLNTAGQEQQPIDYHVSTSTLFVQSGDSLPPVVDSYQITDPVESPFAHGLENSEAVKLPNIFSDIAGQNADTAVVNVEVYLISGDNSPADYDPARYAPIDFRNNDTTRTSVTLANYYAYDDGTAEYAAALNASGTSIAYKYDMAIDTSVYIVAIDIYFPFIGTDPAGKPIELTIWQSIAENGEGETIVAHREDAAIQRNPALNSFVRYPLRRSVAVTDTFYIGYEQKTSGYLGVGLDKNTSSGNQVYYNLDGTWQQNTIISGSLMMRPVFGAAGDTLTTGINPVVKPSQNISVYPNPSSDGLYRISGKFQHLKVYDLRGLERSFSLTGEDDAAVLDLRSQPAGMYLLQFMSNRKLQVIKVLKE